MAAIEAFCRDCFSSCDTSARRCPSCQSPRLVRHAEVSSLSVAHIDCDAFYASVEKRDRPELRDKPVIVGGQQRGVVSTACYIARIHGVRSAMPMFQALKLCPEAVVIKPDMRKYAEAGKQVRAIMQDFTPLVQPISIDEAFLDLSGTERLHGQVPAISLAKLERRIEDEVGVTASIGLSHNKFLAKMASDLEKPRGFSIIGKAETLEFLARQPVGKIWGVGKVTQERLERAGISMIGQLQRMERNDLIARFGKFGNRLYYLSRGQDMRDVSTEDEEKSVSAETTFNEDLSRFDDLEPILWRLAQKVSRRAKASGVAGRTITLKLKTSNFQIRSRNVSQGQPTNLAHHIFDAARALLQAECKGEPFRLIGVGISKLVEGPGDEVSGFDTHDMALTKAEQAIDKIRAKFGQDAVERGLALRPAAGAARARRPKPPSGPQR
jgi:DNA polymerase IV